MRWFTEPCLCEPYKGDDEFMGKVKLNTVSIHAVRVSGVGWPRVKVKKE